MDAVAAGQVLSATVILTVALGTALLLPGLQTLIEQQRTQRVREREYVRRCRMEIEV